MVAGGESVMLFFVLSGFVLSIPFYSNNSLNYGSYLTKRICRIYIPYLAAIFGAYILRQNFYSGDIFYLSRWFNVNWSSPLNTKEITDHLFLIGTFMSNLNNVVWSLVHEMRISIIFPFLMFLLLRLNWKQSVTLGFVLSLFSITFQTLTKASFNGTEYYATFHYCSLFIMGATLSKYRYKIRSLISTLSKTQKSFIFAFGILLYLYIHPSFMLNYLLNNLNPFYRTVIDSWFTGFGTLIIISFAISSNSLSKILKNKIALHLGKISYSLYLCHLPVLLTSIHLLNRILPIGIICLIAIVVTFIVASLMYYLVEKPAIKVGRYLTRPKKFNQTEKQEAPA